MNMKKVGFWTILLLALTFEISCSKTTSKEEIRPKLDQQTINNLVANYRNANNEALRTEILEKLLKANTRNSHLSFYSLLCENDGSNLFCFKAALKNAGTAELFIHLSDFMIESIKSKGEEESKLISKKLNNQFELLEDERREIAWNNKDILIAVLKKIFAENKDNSVFLKSIGPFFALGALKETGFEALLKSVQSKTDEGMILFALEIFRGYAVIPVLKQYENPKSTKKEREVAAILINCFSEDRSVIDKVVEACRHGRYFEIDKSKRDKDGKIVLTMETALSLVLTNWMNPLKKTYEGKTEVAKYIALNHLSNPEGQEDVVNFLAAIDFPTAIIYFCGLNFDSLTSKSLGALIHAARPEKNFSQISTSQDPNTEEKYLLFYTLFSKLSPTKRETHKLIYGLGEFQELTQCDFIVGEFRGFTNKEKDIAIFLGSKLSWPVKEKLYKAIEKDCNAEQLRMVKFYGEKSL